MNWIQPVYFKSIMSSSEKAVSWKGLPPQAGLPSLSAPGSGSETVEWQCPSGLASEAEGLSKEPDVILEEKSHWKRVAGSTAGPGLLCRAVSRSSELISPFLTPQPPPVTEEESPLTAFCSQTTPSHGRCVLKANSDTSEGFVRHYLLFSSARPDNVTQNLRPSCGSHNLRIRLKLLPRGPQATGPGPAGPSGLLPAP